MGSTPDIRYDDQSNRSFQPSWSTNTDWLGPKHKAIFERTRNIPGWQARGDSHKLYEMGYFAGDVILEVGTFNGRSATVSLNGALANPTRRVPPQFYGIDINVHCVWNTWKVLGRKPRLREHVLLFHGNLNAFVAAYPIRPTMVFVDGDHQYEGVREDLDLLGQLLQPGVPVLCHDYTNPENETGEYGIRRAVAEWVESGYAEPYGVFGCAALLVTTNACAGQGRRLLDSETLARERKRLLARYRPSLPRRSFRMARRLARLARLGERAG